MSSTAFEENKVTIIAVTGMTKEAEIVGGDSVIAVAGGGDAKGLAAKLDALHGDITGVISVGLGGGLSPLLKVGDAVIADRIIAGSEIFRCSDNWRVALAARLPHAHQGALAASDIILDTADAKTALFAASGRLSPKDSYPPVYATLPVVKMATMALYDQHISRSVSVLLL